MMGPLRPELFDRLRLLFGDVEIHNKGSEAIYGAPVFDFVTGKPRACELTQGEYYVFSCPFCSDTRKRLWMNYRFGTVDASGQVRRHLAICYNCLFKGDKRRALWDRIFGFDNRRVVAWTGGEKPAAVADVDKTYTLPGECVPVADAPANHPAVRYLLVDRRFSLDVLAEYDVQICLYGPPAREQRELTGWIVMPITQAGVLQGYQARYPGELNWKAAGFGKYYTKASKSRLLYAYDTVVDKPFVVLVEGVTSVWRLTGYAVASLGKGLSPVQAHLLAQLGKPVVVLYDQDAVKEAVAAHGELRRLGLSTVPAKLPDGLDPATADPELTWRMVFRNAELFGVKLWPGK